MAFDAGTVEGKLELDARGFVDSLKRATTALDRMAKQNKASVGAVEKFRKALSLMRDLVIVLPALFRGLSAPLRGFVNFLKESSNAAAEFQQAMQELSVTLSLAGAKNIPTFVAGMKDFAAGIQNATAWSDTMVLKVSQTLAVLGVQQDQLQMATSAVLDYAAATGRDARNAAVQFGRTLAGLLGELGEAFPALRSLTAAQLEAGGAFEFASRMLGGFSEQVAKTTKGLRAQFINAFTDLHKAVGFALNPVLDAITKGATEAVKAATAAVQANETTLTNTFRDVARGIVKALRALADTALDFPVWVARAKKAVAEVSGALSTALIDFQIHLSRVFLGIREQIADLALAASQVPFLGRGLDEVAVRLAEGVAAARIELAQMEKTAASAKAPFEEAARQAGLTAESAKATADAIRDGTKNTGKMAEGYLKVKGILDKVDSSLDNIGSSQEATTRNIKSGNQALSARLQKLREINGISPDMEASSSKIRQELVAAAAGSKQLAAGAREAEGALRGAAAAAGSIGAATEQAAGGLRGGMGGEAGRGVLGTRSFDLSDPFRGIGTLQEQQRLLQGTGAGWVQRAQRGVVEGIRNEVQANVDRAFADATADILQELNSRGVFDPEQRSQQVAQRLAELERLGVLPPREGAAQRGIVLG